MNIQQFFDSQLQSWHLAADNYSALQDVQCKHLSHGVTVQYNPARIRSTGAKMDDATIKSRPCFLCSKHRPLQQQVMEWGDYEILVNPYPIFPRHFTLPLRDHTPQRIFSRVADMARIALKMPGYTVFYNGPQCGASAPDHLHFQAGNSDFLPIWEQVPPLPRGKMAAVEVFGSMGVIVLSALTPEQLSSQFEKVYISLPQSPVEPMLNLLVRADADEGLTALVIPRKRHRPTFYGDGEGQMVISPASVDLAGVFITPRREDFDSIDDAVVAQIFAELCFTVTEAQAVVDKCPEHTAPVVSVGLMTEPHLDFVLHGTYLLDGEAVTGAVSLSARNVKDPLLFVPTSADCFAEVKDVMIGVNFHWQRREDQSFRGSIKVIREGDGLTIINILDVEEYLRSVISSEMSATSSLELLKAHAVISRSWVLAQILAHKQPQDHKPGADPGSATSATSDLNDSLYPRRIVWYDHDDHTLFDVCADDHCQRYQGITRASTEAVNQAIDATRGQVIAADGSLCDARFSKCCGGVFEEFEACWGDTHKSYLVPRRDSAHPLDFPDLTIEENARKWILSAPDAFCNTNNSHILRQVLNSYDQETADFYRWTVEYDTDTLSSLVARRTGIDFGRIIDLIPIKRGTSGRIIVLRIVGEKHTMEIGKELEIRRSLSESHLYSSAFVVEHTDTGIRLIGAGWGHGVGLCQIGAAVMAHDGYDYRQILAHYYPGSEIKENYKP